jgi:hypothetical protein
LVQCDLVTLKQVKVLSRPEWWGNKFCFRVYSDEDGVATIYIGAYRRQLLIDQIAKHQDDFVDIEVNRVPWITKKESGTMFYLMEIKES